MAPTGETCELVAPDHGIRAVSKKVRPAPDLALMKGSDVWACRAHSAWGLSCMATRPARAPNLAVRHCESKLPPTHLPP